MPQLNKGQLKGIDGGKAQGKSPRPTRPSGSKPSGGRPQRGTPHPSSGAAAPTDPTPADTETGSSESPTDDSQEQIEKLQREIAATGGTEDQGTSVPEVDLPADTPKRPKRPKRPPMQIAPRGGQAFTPDLSKLVPLDDKQEYLRVVLYGDYGVGKTTSMATLAKRGKLVVVDPEGSVRKSALRRQGIPTDNILLWTDWAHGGLEQAFVTIKAELEREPGSIFAVAIDTVSSLVQFLLEEAVRTSLATPAMIKAHPTRTALDVYQEDYGTLTEMVKSTITRKWFTLPCHVVLTAHTRRGENETGLIRVGPALPPAAQGALMMYSDWVFKMDREEDRDGLVSREVRTAPRGQVEAKERFGVLDPLMKDVSLLDLLEIWESEQ